MENFKSIEFFPFENKDKKKIESFSILLVNPFLLINMSKIQKGKHGEEIAISYLTMNDFEILERNFRNSNGEIDIIAKKGETIYFIEVKNWKSTASSPLEIFTKNKISKMRNLAEYYFWKRNEKESNYYVSFGLIFIENHNVEFFFDLF